MVADLAGTPEPHAWSMVVDDQLSRKWELVVLGSEILFSPDSSRVAYRAQGGTKWYVVLDGDTLIPEFRDTRVWGFSADSRHFACQAWHKGQFRTAIDGKLGPPYAAAASALWFTPEGAVEYVVVKGNAVHRVTQR